MITNKEIKETITSTELTEVIVEAIQDKKGQEIIRLDLREIDEASADYFIICQGTSPTQVTAIAENVIDHTKNTVNERAIGHEGFRVGEWALVDFFNVVVHIFVPPVRQQFALEDLWGDAHVTHFDDLN